MPAAADDIPFEAATPLGFVVHVAGQRWLLIVSGDESGNGRTRTPREHGRGDSRGGPQSRSDPRCDSAPGRKQQASDVCGRERLPTERSSSPRVRPTRIKKGIEYGRGEDLPRPGRPDADGLVR